MSNEEEYKWLWDEWGSKEEVLEEFLKGPKEWSATFHHWVARFIAYKLLANWEEQHDDNDLIREAAEFVEQEAMGDVGDPDAEQMVKMLVKRQKKKGVS